VTATAVPVGIHDAINAAILRISEDRLSGFHEEPFAEIASRSGIPLETVVERLRAMLEAGTIRRIRQTFLTTNLAAGALIAWKVPPAGLDAAFDFMFRDDPFSGHVVLRSTDRATPGADYRLWTTLKVPQGFSLTKHAAYLASIVGAEAYRIMPARCLFALGVGHLRRQQIGLGERAAAPADILHAEVIQLDEAEWRVLAALKRELTPAEVGPGLWQARARESGLANEAFLASARTLEKRGVLGRFSTFLEHVKPLSDGEPVTRYNGLFHWSVPRGREIEAGREIGRHLIVTHAYWREAGPEFGNVNVMAVTHGLEKDRLLAHKTAMDSHLAEAGIAIAYTNVFWGGRSEIKPSEIMPGAYRAWCVRAGLDPEAMRPEADEVVAAG
jgi:AsnC-like protein/siroheme decarboxylase NirDL-like protein